jgi:XamI restriction endonuclease
VTSQRRFVSPPLWVDEALDERRRRAIDDFIAERAAEGNKPYEAAFAANVAEVESIFAETGDLRDFATGAALASKPGLTLVARYLAGPPVSADDLNTLAGQPISGRKRLSPEAARRAATVIDAVMDRARFPWLFDDRVRSPTATERQLAINWTAGLRAIQQIQTGRRGESATRQEGAVEAVLSAEGFKKVNPRPISLADDLSRREFCRESLVVGAKCHVPIRLWDGRLLLIECKVSNSATNSVKRLNRECGGKAATWLGAFGSQSITSAVLAGVFKMKNLRDAQERDRLIVSWANDLRSLATFLGTAV